MITEDLRRRNFVSEFIFTTSRSSGPGGQNVNKVSTKVELRINIPASSLLSPEEKRIICEKLKKRINSKGELILSSQKGRTQILNREIVTEKFFELLSRSLEVLPERKPTKPSVSSKTERIEKKRKRGYIKKLRKEPGELSD